MIKSISTIRPRATVNPTTATRALTRALALMRYGLLGDSSSLLVAVAAVPGLLVLLLPLAGFAYFVFCLVALSNDSSPR